MAFSSSALETKVSALEQLLLRTARRDLPLIERALAEGRKLMAKGDTSEEVKRKYRSLERKQAAYEQILAASQGGKT